MWPHTIGLLVPVHVVEAHTSFVSAFIQMSDEPVALPSPATPVALCTAALSGTLHVDAPEPSVQPVPIGCVRSQAALALLAPASEANTAAVATAVAALIDPPW
jgi:hypothetical protein